MPARSTLKMSMTRGKEFESFGDALRSRHVENVGNIQQEQNRLERGANSAAQQKFLAPGGGSFSRNLEQSLRRSKARQGIINRGDASIRSQQLKDRLQLAKQSIGRRGTLQRASENSIRFRSGLSAVKRSAKSQVGQAFAGAAGFIGGSAIRGFGDNLFNSGSEIPVATDQGTAAADFFNPSQGGLDFGLQGDFYGSSRGGRTGNA